MQSLGSTPSTVLVVDDDLIHCRFMEATLDGEYKVHSIHSVPETIAFLRQGEQPPDIILLDFNLPEGDGRQLLHSIKANPLTENIPIIFVTAEADMGLQEQTLELGAVDYLIKPVQAGILKSKIRNHISAHHKRRSLHAHNIVLNDRLSETILELQLIQDVTILALATLTEVKNNETGEHIWRTQEYVKVLAQELRGSSRYQETLSEKDVHLIYKSAPLHDIGKVGIPDHILNKPSPLTDEEMEVMKGHTLIGYNALTHSERLFNDKESSFLRYAREICCSHHERWDGCGYPHGLSGEAIPLSARIMAIADVYDALITERVYKSAYEHDEAIKIIANERGRGFDPYLVDLFMANHSEFRAIAGTSQQTPYSPPPLQFKD